MAYGYIVLGALTGLATILHVKAENYGWSAFSILLTAYWLRLALTTSYINDHFRG